jgi:hypothetical protein
VPDVTTTTTRYPYEKADQIGLWVCSNPVGIGYEVCDHTQEDKVIAHFKTIADADHFIDGALWAAEELC